MVSSASVATKKRAEILSSDPILNKGRLLTQEEVLAMWPISRRYLSEITNHPSEAERLPSIKLGRRPFYAPEELMWYREKHRFQPKRGSH